MAQGMFHRAGVAIMMIATLLVPYGRCESPRRTTAHECCAQAAAPGAGIKASCCTIRSQLPAIVVERAVLNPSLLPALASFVPAAEPPVRFEAAATTAYAHHSPPPGASVLRI